MTVFTLGNTGEGRLRFQNSENISARVCPANLRLSVADEIVDIRELKLLSEFSHPNIVKFVSRLINARQINTDW
jgi:hypothetical protein